MELREAYLDLGTLLPEPPLFSDYVCHHLHIPLRIQYNPVHTEGAEALGW